MGLFDQLGQAATGMLGQTGNNNPLLQAVVGLLAQNSHVGGLSGLIQAFQKNGLGDIVNSWVGTGKNLPISSEQIQQGLGGDLLKQLASQAGLSTDAVGGQLASLLPGLIDKLTPGGKVPESDLIEQGLTLLRGKLG
ncbi:MAG TPA: YidB family protein [Nitrospira sp.]|nr:YidB family protein [Nitrospira sp.]HQV12443.1 YidB family protein [Nitrospira sp.]